MPVDEAAVRHELKVVCQGWSQRSVHCPYLTQMPSQERPCNMVSVPTLLWPFRGHLHYGIADQQSGWHFATFKRRQLIYYPPGCWSIRNSDQPFCLIKLEWQHELTLITVNDSAQKYFFEKPAVDAYVIDQLASLSDAGHGLVNLQLNGLLALALAQMQQRKRQAGSKARHRFLSCCEHIREHLHEDIDRQGVADIVGIHPGHVSRLFKQFHPGGYDAWLREERVRRARQLLADDLLSVADIAHLCGISNVSWFIRCFKQETGLTPAAYRHSLA